MKGVRETAASGSPVAVSGWDVARGGPRRTRFAVPAGSVYFVEGDFAPGDARQVSALLLFRAEKNERLRNANRLMG